MANSLLDCKYWNPQELAYLIQGQGPALQPLPEGVPFAQALPLAISVPDKDWKTDLYIDVDINYNSKWAAAEVALTTHIFIRTIDKAEDISSNDLVSISKLLAEVGLEDQKVLLVWLIDTIRLHLSLPEDKSISWCDRIDNLLETERTNFNDLETLIKYLTLLSIIIPQVKNLISCLWHIMEISKNRWDILISDLYTINLWLHQKPLKYVREGINMNLFKDLHPTNC